MDQLNKYRNKLDIIDTEIMTLLDERFKIIADIKVYKEIHKLPVYDKNREQEILNKTMHFNYHNQLLEIYDKILSLSKHLQRG